MLLIDLGSCIPVVVDLIGNTRDNRGLLILDYLLGLLVS
jgi:hypothetical protein